MLRAGLIVVSGALLVAAVLVFLSSGPVPGLFAAIVWGAVTLGAVLFERTRYAAILAEPPGPDWQATPEKFIDPTTGEAVVVYVHPASGRRAYVKA